MPICPSTDMLNCSTAEYTHLHTFATNYEIIHIPLALTICVCGVLANAANVVVLSQPGMRSSTNLLMAALSIGEGSVMMLYIFYVSLFRIHQKLEFGMSKPYAYALFLFVYSQNLFHAFSSWMFVFVTAFRLVFMRAGVAALIVCSYSRAKIIIATDAVLSLVLSAPFLFAHHVVKDCSRLPNETVTFKLDFVSNYALTTLLLVSTGLFMKVLPIVLCTIFSALLIRTLLKSQKAHARLQNEKSETEQRFLASQVEHSQIESMEQNPANPVTSNGCRKTGGLDKRQALKRHSDVESNSRNIHQTTTILIALNVLYIITYLPQALMLLLLLIYDRCFEVMVYEKLGDFMDLLTLLCNGGNFILYCALSCKFRETFLQLFFSTFRCKKSRR